MRTRTTAAAAALALAALLAVQGCARRDDSGRTDAGRPLRVMATTGMVANLASAIGGDLVKVETLMGPGVDPHLYKASEGDVRRLQGADLILYNGLHLEAKLADVFERMRGRALTVAVAEAVPADRLLSPPEFAGTHDPHVWFDVALWRLAAQTAEAALAAASPAGSPVFAANARRFLAELDSLDAYVRARAAMVPPAQRVLITAHDAFNYFGRAYGFEVRGLQGISTAAEAGAADVQDLAAFIAKTRVPAIFVESSVSPRAIEAVQAAVRARGFAVRIGGSLYSDALGPAGTPAGTYIGMVRHNIDTIVAGLFGEPTPAAEGER
jgi:manganese/zinc/iron transport system substrate-binding protein